MPDVATLCSKLYIHPLTTLCLLWWVSRLLAVKSSSILPYIWRTIFKSVKTQDLRFFFLVICCLFSQVIFSQTFNYVRSVRKIFCFKISQALKKPLCPKGEQASLLAILCSSTPGTNSNHPHSQYLKMWNSLKTRNSRHSIHDPSPIQEIQQQRPAIMRKQCFVPTPQVSCPKTIIPSAGICKSLLALKMQRYKIKNTPYILRWNSNSETVQKVQVLIILQWPSCLYTEQRFML